MVNNPKITIGLNETKFGLAPPSWLAGSYVSTIGQRQAEKAIQLGTIFNPENALSVGLVDELANDAEDVMDRSRKTLSVFGRNQAKARGLAKTLIRQPAIHQLRSKFDSDVELYVKLISSKYFQSCVDSYVKSLSKKKWIIAMAITTYNQLFFYSFITGIYSLKWSPQNDDVIDPF